MVNTFLNSRDIIITPLSSTTIVPRRSSVNVRSNKRTINGSRRHTTLRRLVRTPLRSNLNTNISKENDFIRSRRQQINRNNANSNSRLTLTLKRINAIILRHNIMTSQRANSRVVNSHRLNDNGALLVDNVRLTMTSVIRSNTNRRINFLRRSTRETTRINFFSLVSISTIVPRLTINGVMRAISRINSNNLANTNNARRNSLLAQFNMCHRIVRRQLTLLVNRIRLYRS